jgi:hypothetical protein
LGNNTPETRLPGCSTKQIQAISGHATLKEVERYTKAAEQKRLAAPAMSTINEQNWLTDESGSPKSSGRVLKVKGRIKPCWSSLDQHVEDLALGVDGAPQIDHPAIDFQIDFVEMQNPPTDRFIADHQSALSQKILDIPIAQREPE